MMEVTSAMPASAMSHCAISECGSRVIGGYARVSWGSLIRAIHGEPGRFERLSIYRKSLISAHMVWRCDEVSPGGGQGDAAR